MHSRHGIQGSEACTISVRLKDVCVSRTVCRIYVFLYKASGPAGNWYQDHFRELDFHPLALAGHLGLMIL